MVDNKLLNASKFALGCTAIVIHNCVIHPLLPLADLMDVVKPGNKTSRVVYMMHDWTAIKGYS